MREIKIGLPPYPFLRNLYISFIKLIDFNEANMIPYEDHVLIKARGKDVRPVLARAYKYAQELVEDNKAKGFRNEFPLSGNDKSPLKKLFRKFGLAKDSEISDALNTYADELIRSSHLQNFLYPFSTKGDLQLFKPSCLIFIVLLEHHILMEGMS